MTCTRLSLLAAFLSFALCGCSHLRTNNDVLFQTSTISALLEGAYDGTMTCNELKKHGDLGIGTFDGLDGEMVVMDGDVYQVRADGIAYSVDNSVRTPFAAVTFFEPDEVKRTDTAMDYGQLQEYLDTLLPTKNIFYAFKIRGLFAYIKTRSVPRQTKPYPRLVEVAEHQPTFEFRNVRGTIVGFRLPAYMEGVNVPGYHFHFITTDRKAGGHVLDCRTQDVTIEIDHTSEFYMVLPKEGGFYEADFERAKPNEVERVEK